MTWILETPWPSLTLGIGLEVILAIALVRTGRGVIIGAMVLVLALTVGLVVLERVVVTQTEEVENALDGVAQALEANDAPAVLASIAPSCPRRGEVQSVLNHVTIRSARVRDVEVRFDGTDPPSATVNLLGIVEAHDTHGTVPYEHFLRRFKVLLRKDGDRWLITDFSEAERLRPR
jgi:hypothetical protein